MACVLQGRLLQETIKSKGLKNRKKQEEQNFLKEKLEPFNVECQHCKISAAVIVSPWGTAFSRERAELTGDPHQFPLPPHCRLIN